MSDERGLRFAPDEAYPDMAAMLAEYRRVARDHAHNAGLVAITPEEHAERLALRAAVLRYGRALAAVRAEQARLRSIGYYGRTADAPNFDALLIERWAAQDAIDALALALATEVEEGPGGASGLCIAAPSR